MAFERHLKQYQRLLARRQSAEKASVAFERNLKQYQRLLARRQSAEKASVAFEHLIKNPISKQINRNAPLN